MNRIIIFYLIMFCMSTASMAQTDKINIKKTGFWIGPQISLPIGDLAKTQSWGLGISALGLYSIAPKTAVGGRLGYTYLFGKKFNSQSYDPGSYYNYSTSSKYKGVSDIGISGSIRQSFGDKINVGGNNNETRYSASMDLGVCIDSEGAGLTSSALALADIQYHFGNTKLAQALAMYFGLCGDPKLQVGIRYYIGF
jgi:hypothetical protein